MLPKDTTVKVEGDKLTINGQKEVKYFLLVKSICNKN